MVVSFIGENCDKKRSFIVFLLFFSLSDWVTNQVLTQRVVTPF